MKSIRVCPRCSMKFVDGVAYPSFSSKPVTSEWVSQKVCQFAHAQDSDPERPGDQSPAQCINPTFNPEKSYGEFDEGNVSSLDYALGRALGTIQ